MGARGEAPLAGYRGSAHAGVWGEAPTGGLDDVEVFESEDT